MNNNIPTILFIITMILLGYFGSEGIQVIGEAVGDYSRYQ